KQPAAVTTLIVCLLFALFAYNNLDAMYDTTQQRFAALKAIKEFTPASGAADQSQIRTLLEPTLTPSTYSRVRATHVTSDILTIAGLCAMELRRRRLQAQSTA